MELIPIDTQLKMFDEHLSINERTILSAKFGDGKTFFLDKFKKEYKKKYYFITLYPVNYSVAENADVFEYIKRDILLQLANDGMLNPIDLNAAIDSIFNWNTLKEVINFLLTFLPQGEILNKIIEKAKKFKKKYDEKKANFNKYDEEFEYQRGGIYEHDGYTQLIEKALQYIQENEQKKTVLIIEDLDRIDPAHLFRILNVFGSHFDCIHKKDTNCTPNKFGFDYIVTVFDYDMTEHIFHHFYGQDANYSGYINKFKKRQPFRFSITETGREYLYTYIKENCYIPPKSLNLKAHPTIYEHINKLSIRDICNILDNVEKQIKTTSVQCFNKVDSFTSYCPLTIFIVLLVRMGISRNEVEEYIIATLPDIDLLNLLGTFLMTDVWFYNESSIKYKKVDYIITKEWNKNIIISVSFSNVEVLHSVNNIYKNVPIAIKNAINQALLYVYE
jgi:hypothetical protein